jgi:hypothetical protein
MDSRGSVASIAFVVIIRKAYGYPVKTDYPNLAFKLISPFRQRAHLLLGTGRTKVPQSRFDSPEKEALR